MTLAEGASTRQPNPLAGGPSMFGPDEPGGGRNTLGKRLDLHVLRAMLPYLWSANPRPLRIRVVVALCLLVVATCATVYVPLLFKSAIDALTVKGDAPVALVLPIALIVGYGLVRFLAAASGELRDALFVKVTQRAVRHVAYRVFEHLHGLSLRFHLDRQTGGLSRVIERGTKGIEFVLAFTLFNIVPTVLEILLVCAIMWNLYDFWYALITFVTIGSFIVFTLTVTEWRLKFRREMNEVENTANTRAVDSLLNFETVKYFNNEGHEVRRYDEALAHYERVATWNKTSLSALNMGQAAIIATGLMSVMLMAGQGVVNGNMSVGDFVLVNTYLIQLYLPLDYLGYVYREIKQSLTDMEQLFRLLAVKQEIIDAPDAQPLVVSGGSVTFERVFFDYEADRNILKDVDVTVPAGRTVAIVGPSGAGKSTISRLLFRFYDVTAGRILIDGQDIRKVTQVSLRQSIGIVPQDTVLFNDTVYYNIAYGRPAATKAEVEAAAKLAAIHDFIVSLPRGYETRVGERGLKLSGGEKQRVAIARTILKQPSILVFDEATSALDSHTEKEIQAALQQVSSNRTTLIIAHRLSTVVHADEIIVLEAGRIVERGRHGELLERDGQYAAMWARQLEANQLKEVLAHDLGSALAEKDLASEGLIERNLGRV